MIIGLGIDSVDIHRFSNWHSYPIPQLKKILSRDEIDYCMQNKLLSAQRFAVRFATREAFFKAWHTAFPKPYIPFLTCCRGISLSRTAHNAPLLEINWTLFGSKKPLCTALISVTHTPTVATACVFLQKISK